MRQVSTALTYDERAGVRVLVEEHPRRALAVFNLRVKAGWAFEHPDEASVAHLVEHGLFRGSQPVKGQRSLTRWVAEMGGALDGVLSADTISLWASGPSSRADALLEALLQLAIAPLMKRREIALEQSILKDELRALAAEPLQVLVDDVCDRIFPGGRLSEDGRAVRRRLPSLSARAVRAYHAETFARHGMVLTAAGDVCASTIAATVERMTANLPAHGRPGPTRIPIAEGPCVLVRPHANDLCYGLLAYPAPTYGEADHATLEVLAHLLAGGMESLLYRDLRERDGLLYQVEPIYEKAVAAGVLGVYFECSRRHLVKVVAGIGRALERLQTRPLPRAVVERARLSYQGELLDEFDRLRGRVRQLALSQSLGGRAQSCEDAMTATQRVDAEGVHTGAARYLRSDVACLSVCFPGTVPSGMEHRLRACLP